jgi:hypothetical protein
VFCVLGGVRTPQYTDKAECWMVRVLCTGRGQDTSVYWLGWVLDGLCFVYWEGSGHLSIVTRLRVGWSVFCILGGTRDLHSISFAKTWDQLWCLPSLLISEYQLYFPYVGWPGFEVDHSCPSSAEFKNEWSCTFTPPVFIQAVDRDSLHVYLSHRCHGVAFYGSC